MTEISPSLLREFARGYQHDNHSPGDPGYCSAEDADWRLARVDAERCVGFSSAAEAHDWLQSEIRMAREDGLEREWEALLTEEIREPVVLLDRRGLLYIWDGWHRVASARARGISIEAIVGVPR